ncbi:MAG: ArsB/NhaD family transporter [Gammaproteobacteria bacterium]|nr:ArsB/NhaD family transporter [Gammaproteobacteria bacterium]
MTLAHAAHEADMWVAAGVLVAAYALIFSELIHRTSAAILGAVSMIGAGMLMGFYSQQQAILAIDANTIILLAAMMMLVAMLRPTGAFDYTAIMIARASANDPRRLLVYLSLAVSLISMVLDNVTTIIVFAPLTVLICRILKLNPLPFLMSEAILSNIGGASTLVGDPPNIMIGSAASISFSDFLVHMGPPIAAVWLTTVGLLLLVFRRQLRAEKHALDVQHFDLARAIKDSAMLWRVMLSLLLVMVLFFVHHHFEMFPAFAAFIGLSLALVLLRPEPEELFGEVNWSVLIFFAALFVIVGGVEASGLLDLLGRNLADLARDPDKLLLAGLTLMWVAAVLSAIVDNIPFTVTMIPIIVGLGTAGADITPLWWALALGVGLGGNSTHIGATANLIAVTEAEKSGIANARISPLAWMRVGVPVTVLGLLVASAMYALLFDFLRG